VSKRVERPKGIMPIERNKSMQQRPYSITFGIFGNYNFRHFRAGFTLLEVMIAVAVIAIALVAVFGSQSQSLTLANEAKFNTTAALLAQKKMAEIEVKRPLEPGSASGDFGEDFPGYEWDLRVDDVSFTGASTVEYLKQVDLTVLWGDREQYQYRLRLYRFVPKTKR
jgi:general secretion pathway protein I